jgi:hypothetical protein
VIDKRLKYKNIKGQKHMLAYITPGEAKQLEKLGGQKTMTKEGIPAYPPDNDARGQSTGTSSSGSTSGGDGSTNREKGIMSQYQGPKGTTGNINDTDWSGDGADYSAVGPLSKWSTTPYEKPKTSFFDTGLGKIIKTIGLGIIAPQLLAGTKLGTVVSGYNKAKGLAKIAKSFNITDKNVVTSLTDTVKDKFAGFSTTGTKGPKDPPREGGDGDNQQNALMAEYMLLLKKMEQGILQKEEQGRFNSLKSRLGKARGGRMNDEVRKESQVKQFTPPPEETGILQKLFGIDTDKLYDQGFDSMNKYRERNPDNPREVLQTAGGKLSNLRHGVSTSLLRDAILKKINPGSYEMKEAPPSMNFKELKMSEEGPNKAAKGVASLLAYLGAGTNEIGPGFFSQETMEDLTANLLGLMKTDVYDTPEDKAAMLNEILENDTGGINTYLQSLAPKEKYQEDDSLFPPMRQDKMRDQDLLFMKAEEDYEDKVKNLGLGAMDG